MAFTLATWIIDQRTQLQRTGSSVSQYDTHLVDAFLLDLGDLESKVRCPASGVVSEAS